MFLITYLNKFTEVLYLSERFNYISSYLYPFVTNHYFFKKGNENREQNKMNLFVFYAEGHHIFAFQGKENTYESNLPPFLSTK